jgi:hypothetical protein
MLPRSIPSRLRCQCEAFRSWRDPPGSSLRQAAAGAPGLSFRYSRLNEVALPSASATDAARVVTSGQWVTQPCRAQPSSRDIRGFRNPLLSKGLQFKSHTSPSETAFLQTALSKAPRRCRLASMVRSLRRGTSDTTLTFHDRYRRLANFRVSRRSAEYAQVMAVWWLGRSTAMCQVGGLLSQVYLPVLIGVSGSTWEGRTNLGWCRNE